jgi:hypothetical protein
MFIRINGLFNLVKASGKQTTDGSLIRYLGKLA